MNLTNKVKRNINLPLFRNSLKMSMSNIIMYLLPIIVTPILSRLYLPQDFGEWGIFSSCVSVLCMAMFGGFENALVKAEEREVKVVAKICCITAILMIGIVVLCFYVGEKYRIHFFESFPNPCLLYVYLFFHIFYTLSYNLCNRYEKYTSLSINNIIQGGSQATFRIIFAISGITFFNGLILGTTTSLLISSFFLIISLKNISLSNNSKTTNIKSVIRRYKKFPLFDAPSSLLSFAAFNLPVIILSLYFNKAEIGCLSIIFQLLLMPMSLIGSAIGKVYYQELCKERSEEFTMVTTTRIFKILAIISIIPLAFIACGGDYIIVLFLGNKWTTAGIVALCLALWSFPTILTQPLLPLFRYLNIQNTMLLYDILYFTCGIGTIIISCHITKNLYAILFLFSIACFVSKILLFVKIASLANISFSICKRYIPLWSMAIFILAIRLLTL